MDVPFYLCENENYERGLKWFPHNRPYDKEIRQGPVDSPHREGNHVEIWFLLLLLI